MTHRLICLRVLHVHIDLLQLKCDDLLLVFLFLVLFFLDCDILQDLQTDLVDLLICDLRVLSNHISNLFYHYLHCLDLTLGRSYEELL